ncbi:MAG: hypothetical protein ACXVHR_01285 [Methanobacterium sp.]
MKKLTITLLVTVLLCSGVAGFVLYAQNPQLVPAINIKNTTTSDENYVDPTPKYSNYTKKTTATVKETPTQTQTTTTTKTTTESSSNDNTNQDDGSGGTGNTNKTK